ncbi:hypothetical protein PInf_022158 [Phytophthora infestans]|nr:hypothetical protein PInf_022158 [Phytophthora infestans]
MSEQRQASAPGEAPVQDDTSASPPAPSSPASEDAPVRAVAFDETSVDLDEGVRLIPSASEYCESDDYEEMDSDVESAPSVSTASAPSQEEEEDISNVLFDGDLHTRVTKIINADKCGNHDGIFTPK